MAEDKGASGGRVSNNQAIAKGSLSEVESQLYVALDQGYVDKVRFDELYEAAEEVARLLSGFIHYLLKKDRAALPGNGHIANSSGKKEVQTA